MIRKLHLSLFFVLLGTAAFSKDKIIVTDAGIPKEKREAILLLNGFGSLYHSDKNQIKALGHQGFDLLIPDYISRQSIAGCVENLQEFYANNHLSQYKAIHVFAYIVGSWTVNQWIPQYHPQNIASIVYDRSALQERVPQILDHDNPLLSGMFFGKIMHDLAEMQYPVLANPSCNTGLIIECKASHILFKKKSSFDALPPIHHEIDGFHQPTPHYAYYFQSHDDLYTQLDQISEDILHFFREGKFPPTVSQSPCSLDPFGPYYKP